MEGFKQESSIRGHSVVELFAWYIWTVIVGKIVPRERCCFTCTRNTLAFTAVGPTEQTFRLNCPSHTTFGTNTVTEGLLFLILNVKFLFPFVRLLLHSFVLN